MKYILIVLALFIASPAIAQFNDPLAARQQQIRAQQANIPIPRVAQGGTGAFDDACRTIAAAMDDFYKSSAFQSTTLAILTLCLMIGITWRARGLMWGEEEIGGFLWWMFFRITVGLSCYFVIGPKLAPQLTDAMNAISTQFANITRRTDATLLPAIEARLSSFAADNDAWLTALNNRLGKKITSIYGNSEPMVKWGQRNPQFSAAANFEGTLTNGFSAINYGSGTHNTQSPYYKGGVPPVPYTGYADKHNLYIPAGAPPLTGFEQPQQIRPLIPALEAAGKRLYMEAARLNYGTPQDEINRFLSHRDGAVARYKSQVHAIKMAYLRDYAAWRLHFKDEWGAIDGVEELPSGSVFANDKNTAPSEVMQALLNSINVDMDAIARERTEAKFGKIMGALIPLALGIVGFYCTISIWCMPIGFAIWSACFFLPKELELSGTLKKGAMTIITLLCIPLFANLVVDVSLAFIGGVTAASIEGYMGTVSAGLTGLFGASLVPSGLGPISFALKAGSALGAGVWSASQDINIFVMASWIVAFLMIIATPRIVSGIVFATGGFAETLLQKVQMGGALATTMVAMSARTVASNKGSDIAGIASVAGKAGSKGIAGLKNMIQSEK